jgi:glycosyltransferase involved in cell wall biosynthesis
MKIAIIHDWLTEEGGGAEKVLSALVEIFPKADLYTLICTWDKRQKKQHSLENTKIFTSSLQRLPWAKKAYRNYLPLMPYLIQQFDLSEYDLIISSSYCVAKGVITGPDQIHISYCHSPVRYAWDLQHQYLRESGLTSGLKSILVRKVLNDLRDFDFRTSQAVDHFIVNSSYIKKRVWKFYKRDSTVVFPPVDTSNYHVVYDKEDYYFTCSRLVSYKKIKTIVEAFADLPEKRLIVAGTGPDFNEIANIASKNVTMLGYVEFEKLVELMQKARAFLYMAEEDFGIVPVEAQSCGTPVICYGKAGVLDSVINNITGIFFDEQTKESLINAIAKFEENTKQYDPKVISDHAKNFSIDIFKNEVTKIVTDLLNQRG